MWPAVPLPWPTRKPPRNACGGADEVPELAEGEAALKDALPLAEALDEVALDPWWSRGGPQPVPHIRIGALTHAQT